MTTHDVVVIGGGAAGLSGALTLARARRSVLVVDAGAPRNAPAAGVHGFLTRDGMAPADLVATGRAEVERYGGEVVDGEVVAARRAEGGFEVTLGDGQVVTARRLLVTTGLVDELPDVAGVRERWGDTVVHCPYCHGWELRDEAIGVLGANDRAAHQALLFRQWTDDVVLFRHTAPALTHDELEQLGARGVEVVDGLVAAFDDEGVHLAGGTVVARAALAVATRMVARTDLLAGLGLEVVEHPMGVGAHVPADPTGRTAVPGVWVAGNVADLMAQVVAAAAGGTMAGAALNADLIAEDTERAVTGVRAHFSQPFWDERYASTDRVWSGNPNARLVEHVTGLTPGTALEVGSGEGADAIWLAQQGWQVTAVDVSPVALERAAARAGELGVADRITWEQADVLTWDPAPRRFDLVSTHFMQLPRPARDSLHQRLAGAVGAGGRLLVVGHHPQHVHGTSHHSHLRGMLFTAEEVARQLDPEEWEVLVADAPVREGVGPDGQPMTMHDAVLHARRVARPDR